MPSRFDLSLAAAAALVAGFAVAAPPGAAVVVAQLGPTSPAFKMSVNRGETGAPEPGAVTVAPSAKPTDGQLVLSRPCKIQI